MARRLCSLQHVACSLCGGMQQLRQQTYTHWYFLLRFICCSAMNNTTHTHDKKRVDLFLDLYQRKTSFHRCLRKSHVLQFSCQSHDHIDQMINDLCPTAQLTQSIIHSTHSETTTNGATVSKFYAIKNIVCRMHYCKLRENRRQN